MSEITPSPHSGIATPSPASGDHAVATTTRRQMLAKLASLGVGTAVFRRALVAQAGQDLDVTVEMIQQAEWIADVDLSEDERGQIVRELSSLRRKLNRIRATDVDYDVPPAVSFHVAADPANLHEGDKNDVHLIEAASPKLPASGDDIAFLPVSKLANLIRTRKISSVELTKIYLERLHRFDPLLKCVVTFTEDLALRQAKRADHELAQGWYRGPLHGIPWGAKDLIAYPGYPTSWGATPFKDQVLDAKATVAKKLDRAGAVLVAKLSLGALAQGDKWFGGMTRNPWNPEQGSSGSSAGPAAAVAAGLVGFAIGSETCGSIVSPCRRCSATGLRPTFGRVSRFGCMSLSWSMDKIGPIARGVEDCALILGTIAGYDSRDRTTTRHSFHWPLPRDIRKMRVGYFEHSADEAKRPELEVLKKLGVELVPIELPNEYPLSPLMIILNTEASAAFTPIARQKLTDGLGRWPHVFWESRFISAVDYLRANRIRTQLMDKMETLMADIDAYVGGDDLVLTNMTGHPTVALPGREPRKESSQQPEVITLTGKLFGETSLLAIAHAYQTATDFHQRRPPLEAFRAEKESQQLP